MHTSDTVQEKLSLAARFGVTIYYGMPVKQGTSRKIVRRLAERYHLDMSEEELMQEEKGEMHGNSSTAACPDVTATQFITNLLGKEPEE